jgi:hypothetical protein
MENIERTFFTDQRTKLLLNEPELAITETLGRYCFVPLDIPKIENPNFAEWFFNRSVRITKIGPDIAGYSSGSLFDAVDIFPQGNDFNYDKVWTINPQNEFLTLFPDLYDQILEYIPYSNIWRIRFFSSHAEVPFHRDHSKFIDFPGAFRIIMHDENPMSSLKLIDCPFKEQIQGRPFVIPRLKETNSFAWNNLRTKHGSNFNTKYRKIIAILDYGKIDVKKYMDLMNRSISKYQKYTMMSNNNTEDYLDL